MTALEERPEIPVVGHGTHTDWIHLVNETKAHDPRLGRTFTINGLANESVKVQSAAAQSILVSGYSIDTHVDDECLARIEAGLGGVLWFVYAVCYEFGLDPREVYAQINNRLRTTRVLDDLVRAQVGEFHEVKFRKFHKATR